MDRPHGVVDKRSSTDVIGAPEVVGLHHVRMPVANVLTSRDWYLDILGFEPMLVVEEEDRVTGVVLEHPSGVMIGLHEEPERAQALRGFVVLGLSVTDIAPWIEFLDQNHVRHGPSSEGHLGCFIWMADPDGILVELHTAAQPSADEA